MRWVMTDAPELSPVQRSRCLLHSLVAIHGVIAHEIDDLEQRLPCAASFPAIRALCADFDVLANEAPDVERIREHLGRLAQTIDAELDAAAAQDAHNRECGIVLSETRDNLTAVMGELRRRVEELAASGLRPETWRTFSLAELRRQLKSALLAMARNGRWRWDLRVDPGDPGARPKSYDICFDFSGQDEVSLPALIPDLIRDLVANARKYSHPGSIIRVVLRVDTQGVLLAVNDQGRGIPEEDMPRVVAFGVRGSNVAPEETRAGGMGLTKAQLIATANGGRLVIDSVVGRGTSVQVELPSP